MTLAIRAATVTAALIALHAPNVATADSTLRSDGARVFESSHTRTVQLLPLAAHVHDVHVFSRRASGEATQLYYEFDLPREAAITSLAVRLGRAVHRGTAVDANAAIRMVPDADGGEADLALLREITSEREDLARYQLVVYPLDRGGATLELDWTMPTTLDASRVAVALPERGTAGNLARTKWDVKARGDGPVSKLVEVSRTKRPDATTLQARTLFARPGAPTYRYASTPLGGDLSIISITGIAPPPRQSGARFARMVILLDVSRSMGRQGVEAATALATRIVEAAPSTTRLEVVLFDRKARGVFGKLAPVSKGTADKIRRAAASAPLTNGSDLGAALARAAVLLRGQTTGKRDLRADAVVVISDGSAPVSLTREAARTAVGDHLAENAAFFAIELGVSAHPLPRHPGGSLRALIQTSGGRAWSIWAHRAGVEAAAIVKRLEPTPHTTAVSAIVGGKKIDRLATPAHLGPGTGFVVSTLWRGKPPSTVTIRSRLGGKPVSTTVKRARKPDRARAALLLRQLTAEIIAAAAADRRELAQAGLAVGVVSQRYSFVIPDPASRFGRDRLAFARRWGTALYRRAPSRFELGTESFYKKLEALATGSAVAGAPKPSGQLDRETIQRAVRAQLFRPIRHCYERELRNAKKLSGEISVRFEVSRAEVVSAEVHRAPGMPDSLKRCVIDAAYQLKPPTVFGDSDTSYLIRYPFRLRRSQRGASVERGPDGAVTTPLDTSDPLEGLD